MTTVVWQTQLAKRFMSKGFLLLLVLRSSFSPPPGTRTLWYVSPLQRSISSLPRDSTGGIYKALTCWRMLNIPTLHKDMFPVSSIGKTLINQPQVSAAAEIPRACHRTKSALMTFCTFSQMWKNSHWPSPGIPHPQMPLGLAMIISLMDLPSATCQEAAGQSSSN